MICLSITLLYSKPFDSQENSQTLALLQIFYIYFLMVTHFNIFYMLSVSEIFFFVFFLILQMSFFALVKTE